MNDASNIPKWYAVTLDRVLVGLLLVEGLLFLSDQYDWFACTDHVGRLESPEWHGPLPSLLCRPKGDLQ